LADPGFFYFKEVKMYAIKSPQGRWSIFLCNCSHDTAHFHYGNVVLHISLDDLRELGIAMQTVADNAARPEHASLSLSKKG
jgi:hypothetical protein